LYFTIQIKSFYELIAPEGLADIEQFHLDRLKGKKLTQYSTILLNKENKKIPVIIQFDSIIFCQQKADIAFITPKKNQYSNNSAEQKNYETESNDDQSNELINNQSTIKSTIQSSETEKISENNQTKVEDLEKSNEKLSEKIEEKGE